jgi:NAD(P)-dependent dehydrogenase (short-subunit alcohol dehydrogenase family)
MGRHRWTETDIPDMSGRVAVVTGANTGLGLQTARVLAHRGAHIVLACRNPDKAGRAAEAIGADVSVVPLDLASQASVRAAASRIRDDFPHLDLIINNAGVMEVPYQRTEDGFELTLATNHLGPFALTGLLLDRLAPGGRIVTVSSVGHLEGVIDFADLQAERHYDRERAYAQSKLANLMFTYELDRRLRAADAADAGVIAVACHPGVVHTDLFVNRSKLANFVMFSPAMRPVNFWAVQDVRMGALPALRAATDPAIRGGEYIGPRRYGLFRRFLTGYPAVVESSERSHDEAVQGRLWAVSEQLTGVHYALGWERAGEEKPLPPWRSAGSADRGRQ